MKPLLPMLLAALLVSCNAPDDVLHGYGEGDYLYIASQEAGVVGELSVAEGDVVAKDAPLFRLDPQRARLGAETARAEAASSAASSAAFAQAIAEAEAQKELADSNLARTSALFRDGFIARARLDSDRAAQTAAAARLQQVRAERAAAQRQTGAAQAQSGLAAQRLSDTAVAAPAAGRVERIYRRPGEVVPAGEPVLSLLPPENMKVRFFAPEPRLSSLQLGQRIAVSCDGCPDGLTARISFIATEPQFTPPVIYSREARDTLVFLIEARPEQATRIRPGVPVDVRLAP